MPVDSRRATMFLLAALAWSLGLFALLRSAWVEAQLVLPLTLLQQQAADYYSGPPRAPIAVGVECSGTDVLALCLAVILACPVSWRARLTGAAGAFVFVLGLNTVRIATLGRAAASPQLFQTLHLQVWPAILVLATASYVFAWMRNALEANERTASGTGQASVSAMLAGRFVPRAAVLLVGFALCGPWIARSQVLLALGAWTVGAAAFVLNALGLSATASGNVLATSRGAFLVTPECLATALFPLYVAGVLSVQMSWSWRAVGLSAAPLIFTALAVVRLLLLALPPALAASPLFLVHGFHQLVLGTIAVILLALWREPPARHSWARASVRAGAALAAAAILALVVGAAVTRAVLGTARAVTALAPHTLTALTDPGDMQGALALLPAYQAGLLLALGVAAQARWQRILWTFGILLASQVVLLAALGALNDTGLVAHTLLVRAWAVGVPVVLALATLCRWQSAPVTLAPLQPAVDGPR